MKEFIINENEAGQRFDKYLAKLLRNAPKSFFYKMLRKKNITLNGRKATGNEKLNTGDQIRLFLSDETFSKFSQQEQTARAVTDLDIIYEDTDILLINKPAGMLSQPDDTKEPSMVEYLIGYLLQNGSLTEENLRTFHPSVCNRLDRNTSGIVLCGKTVKGLQMLNEIIKNRTLHKYYRCIVLGETKEQDTLKGFLIKNESANQVTIITEQKDNAVPIETRYKRISTMEKAGNICSLLEVRLITGRPHQIRAHLTSIGHPILGDRKYRNKKSIEISKALHIPHQLLCACSITFPKIKGTFDYLSGKRFSSFVTW